MEFCWQKIVVLERLFRGASALIPLQGQKAKRADIGLAWRRVASGPDKQLSGVAASALGNTSSSEGTAATDDASWLLCARWLMHAALPAKLGAAQGRQKSIAIFLGAAIRELASEFT